MQDSKCKICRRVGAKLFLKGERCLSPKCPMIKRPYPPGEKGKRRRGGGLSEYGKELREKQKLRHWYNLSESQFRKYVREVLGKRGGAEDASDFLIRKLESRLDNVVFRMGFVPSRAQARQAVSHGHFLVNGRKTNIPAYKVKKGDKIGLTPRAIQKSSFKDLGTTLKKYKGPSWIKLDIKKLEAEIVDQPSLDEMAPPAEISSIFEFYSK